MKIVKLDIRTGEMSIEDAKQPQPGNANRCEGAPVVSAPFHRAEPLT